MGMNGANATLARTFPIGKRMNLETSMIVYNLFNHDILGSINTSPTSPQFGEVTGDGWPNSSERWISIQGRLQF